MFYKTTTVVFMIVGLCFSQALADETCNEKLESTQCSATGGTSFCTLSFPEYDDECFEMVSLQTKDLTTYYHYPDGIEPGEWGLSNIRPAPPNVTTVCGQFRECVFQAGTDGAPDLCVPGSGAWHTYWDEEAYDWDDVCQAEEEDLGDGEDTVGEEDVEEEDLGSGEEEHIDNSEPGDPVV